MMFRNNYVRTSGPCRSSVHSSAITCSDFLQEWQHHKQPQLGAAAA
jgi:hypothetical protein